MSRFYLAWSVVSFFFTILDDKSLLKKISEQDMCPYYLYIVFPHTFINVFMVNLILTFRTNFPYLILAVVVVDNFFKHIINILFGFSSNTHVSNHNTISDVDSVLTKTILCAGQIKPITEFIVLRGKENSYFVAIIVGFNWAFWIISDFSTDTDKYLHCFSRDSI